jgi:hypothetical protein
MQIVLLATLNPETEETERKKGESKGENARLLAGGRRRSFSYLSRGFVGLRES